jgi:hypothetical protein
VNPEEMQQLAQQNAQSVIYNDEARRVRESIGNIHQQAVHATALYAVLAQRTSVGDLTALAPTHAANRAVMDVCRAGVDPAAALVALNAYHDDPADEVNPIWLAIQAEAAHQPADVILQEALTAVQMWIETMQAGAAAVMGGKKLFPGVPLPEVEVEEVE